MEDQNATAVAHEQQDQKSKDLVDEITETIQGKLDEATKQMESANETMVNIPRVDISSAQDFEPRIISIGPYHWGNPRLRSMNNQKRSFVVEILWRNRNFSLRDYILRLVELENRVRACYSQVSQLNSKEFVEMMLLDGSFIVDYFVRMRPDFNLISGGPNRNDCNVQTSMGIMFTGIRNLLDNQYMRRIIEHDMLLLQNQLPFFVVQSIFDLAMDEIHPPSNLPEDIFYFFKNLSFLFPNIRPFVNDASISPPKPAQHLLHIYHRFLISAPKPEHDAPNKSTYHLQNDVLRIPSATVLASAGVKFKMKKGLGLSFNQGTMEIPPLLIDGFTKSRIQNLVAFEKSNPQIEPHITAYVKFLGHIIDTTEDVALLHKKGIINHALGSDEEVAHLFNSTGGSTFHDQPHYMKCIYQDVDEYCKIKWHKWRAILMSNYFNSPWSFMKWGAAVILLVLAFLQTFFTIYPYFQPHP